MVDIKHKNCIKCNEVRPYFNKEGEKTPLYCEKCKEADMINVMAKKCVKCNLKVPNFNYENEKKGMYCYDCKLDNMINIVHNMCIICNKKRPSFNKKDETKPTHCNDCKTDDMININNKKCIICNKFTPNFNYSNQKIATHCSKCKESDMIDIIHIKCLECDKIASFNYKNDKPLYCSIHKKDKMINVKHTRCQECKLFITNTTLCTYCNGRKYEKTKELEIVYYLRENINIEEYNFYHNKSIGNSCTDKKIFPDIRFDCLYYQIIIEIDEFKHRGANYNCDKQRMYDIIAKLGQPCVFIRYNPDSKNSDKEMLLKIIIFYLEINYNEIKFEKSGIKAYYMYYD